MIFENFAPHQTLFSSLKIAIFWCIAPINFLTKSLIWHSLCVDKIGSADRGILCVDKIGSPENPQQPCSPLIFSPLTFSPLIRTKPSPGEDPKVGWYCYRATQSRRSHLTYTHRKSSYRPKELSFGKKLHVISAFYHDLITPPSTIPAYSPDREGEKLTKSTIYTHNFQRIFLAVEEKGYLVTAYSPD